MRETLLRLAAAKDAVFTFEAFLDVLNAIDHLAYAEWTEDGVSADAIPQLTVLFAEWRATLAPAGKD